MPFRYIEILPQKARVIGKFALQKIFDNEVTKFNQITANFDAIFPKDHKFRLFFYAIVEEFRVEYKKE
jgi:hypothetical protein